MGDGDSSEDRELTADDGETFQQWMVESIAAQSVPRRAAGLTSKFVIEGTFMTIAAVVFAFFIDLVVLREGVSIPQVPESWPALTVVFFITGMRFGWCWTTEQRQ